MKVTENRLCWLMTVTMLVRGMMPITKLAMMGVRGERMYCCVTLLTYWLWLRRLPIIHNIPIVVRTQPMLKPALVPIHIFFHIQRFHR